MKYAIQHHITKEFLREGHNSGDAYTDDLGQAVIFEDLESAEDEALSYELIIDVEQDEDGCLSLREDKEDGR